MRSISLLTILALLYCPLSCVVGQGHGVSSLLGSDIEVASPVCCCCPTPHKPSQTSQPANSGDSDTHQKDCQGLCSGAVHEREDFSIDSAELPVLVFDTASLPQRIEPAIVLRKHNHALAQIPILSGRQLRTRLLSLTC